MWGTVLRARETKINEICDLCLLRRNLLSFVKLYEGKEEERNEQKGSNKVKERRK